MTALSSSPNASVDILRERNVPTRRQTDAEARKTVLELNALEEHAQKDKHDRKTYGRTPDGIGE
jgi:hypothetical protein